MKLEGNLQPPACDALVSILRDEGLRAVLQPSESWTLASCPQDLDSRRQKAGTVRLFGGSCSRGPGISSDLSKNCLTRASGTPRYIPACAKHPVSSVACNMQNFLYSLVDGPWLSLQRLLLACFTAKAVVLVLFGCQTQHSLTSKTLGTVLCCMHDALAKLSRSHQPQLISWTPRNRNLFVSCLLPAAGQRPAIPVVTLFPLEPRCFASSCSHDIVFNSRPVVTPPAVGTLVNSPSFLLHARSGV